MSKAGLEAILVPAVAVAFAVVFVVGIRRRNGWEHSAPVSIAVLLVPVWFNLKCNVFGGPGFTIHTTEGR